MAKRTIRLAVTRMMLTNGTAQRLRERAGLSRRDIARHLDVTESTYSRWEAGLRSPRPDVALRLGDLLGKLQELDEPHGGA
jgi:transcriptional regulator with XRE-family HTH domain